MENYLEGLLNANPTLAAEISNMQEFYTKRLWHQLTDVLISSTFANDGAKFDSLNLQEMYTGFVKFYETKISPTALVRFVAAAANRNICVSNPPTTEQVAEAQALLDGLADTDAKKKRLGDGACAYLSHERLSLSVRCGGGSLMNVSALCWGLVCCFCGSRARPTIVFFFFNFFFLFLVLEQKQPLARGFNATGSGTKNFLEEPIERSQQCVECVAVLGFGGQHRVRVLLPCRFRVLPSGGPSRRVL